MTAGSRKDAHAKERRPLQQRRETAHASMLQQKPARCCNALNALQKKPVCQKQITISYHDSISQWNSYVSFFNPGS